MVISFQRNLGKLLLGAWLLGIFICWLFNWHGQVINAILGVIIIASGICHILRR